MELTDLENNEVRRYRTQLLEKFDWRLGDASLGSSKLRENKINQIRTTQEETFGY